MLAKLRLYLVLGGDWPRKGFWKWLLGLLVLTGPAGSSEYKFEGFFNNHDNDRLVIVSLFLPYNPTVVIHSEDAGVVDQCLHKWPKGVVYRDEGIHHSTPCHFLWVEDEGNERSILKKYIRDPALTVIYTSTCFAKGASSYDKVRAYLESRGFVLFSHWYWVGEHGHAIFLRKENFDCAMRGWNYSPTGSIHSTPITWAAPLENFFKKALDKPARSSLAGIDFIYVINLDERPEKFAQVAADLQRHSLYPYRFSAVNGWKLPLNVIRGVGVSFTSPMTQEKFMGTVYREVEGKEYISNEKIEREGEIYFALGLTRGAIGILLSHLSVLQDAYDAGYPTIWVMEDDVEVVKEVSYISRLIRNLDQIDPEWDILFTDPDTKDAKGVEVPCRSIAARPNFSMQSLTSFLKRFYRVSGELSRTGMRYGAYSMILRRSGIEKILNYFKAYRLFLPYDMDYWLIPELKMYCPHESVVSHRAGALSDNGRPAYKD